MGKQTRTVAGVTIAALVTLFSWVLGAQQSRRIDVAVGRSIHGIGEYAGALLVNDWRTGETYIVSWGERWFGKVRSRCPTPCATS